MSTRSRPRKSRTKADTDLGSDAEFEMALRAYERQLDDEEQEKEEKRKERAAARAAKVSKQKKKRINKEYCEICNEGGEIILCDTCPRAYHLVCINPDFTSLPEGKWSCSHCETKGPEWNDDEYEDETPPPEEICSVCKSPRFLLHCDLCANSYHAYCLTPPLDELPSARKTKKCNICLLEDPKKEINKVITWRWVDVELPDPVDEADVLKPGESENSIDEERRNRLMLRPMKKMEPRREREFLIKWKYISYWHCEWVNQALLDKFCYYSMASYYNRNQMEIPPHIEEAEDVGQQQQAEDEECNSPKKRDKAGAEGSSEKAKKPTEEDADPYDRRERFYQYGIRPEWLQVHRIINFSHVSKNQYDYLVKWRDLSYAMATWERDDLDIPGYDKAVKEFWIHRNRMTNEPIPKFMIKRINEERAEQGLCSYEEEEKQRKKKEGKPSVDIRKKYEQQPDYISETGGTLHPYQLEGINWLRHCWSNGNNAILADEMGLGKTIQSLEFFYTLMKEGHCKGPFLIAAPLSTLINWEREAEVWCPDFYVVTYVGDRDSRKVIREHEFSFVEGAIRNSTKATRVRSGVGIKFHVLLTSYEMINSDAGTLSSIEWAGLCVDEAHRLKNNESLFFRTLNEYSIRYRLLLTGTPLQNNLEELYHLLNFLSPDRFTDMESFTCEFEEFSKEDQIAKLHNMLGPHMLRRMKADVLQMPSKSELIVRVELSPLQKKYYRNILTRNFEALNVKSGPRMSLMNILMQLKKCCNHPFLFEKASEEAPKLPSGAYEGETLIRSCGKLILLQKMLERLKKQGHRVLIFSQMTRLLDILEEFCEYLGYKYERVDGTVMGQIRQDAIDRFNAPNSPCFLFLLSTRAGGLGINLATADTVIIYDSDWNPHNDIQAFSRAHRIGQKNKVMIYRFVTRNSVEERIATVAKRKMMLTHLVVHAGIGQRGPSMSKTELDDVLRWGTEELFKDDEASGGGDAEKKDAVSTSEGKPKSEQQAIVWDDDAIDALLERNTDDDAAPTSEKKDWTNEYLSTFKVATYTTGKNEAEEEIEEELKQEDVSSKQDPEYWSKLLGHHYAQAQELEAQKFGKGKRVRKQINYATGSVREEFVSGHKDQDQDYTASPSDDGSDDEETDGDDEEADAKRRERNIRRNESLPPLLAKVDGQIEVLGFNPRQRCAFYNAIMRWGMPPTDVFNSQWLVKDLKGKSEREFKTYSALFMRHLCEPGEDTLSTFNDGVPREGLNRQHVLTRLGVMAMIRKKINEYEDENGEWSMPTVRLQLHKAAKAALKSERESSAASERGTSVARDVQMVNLTQDSDSSPSKKNGGSGEANLDGVVGDGGEKKENGVNGTQNSLEDEALPRVVPDFEFSINDGGFTELHSLWVAEEKVALPGKEFEIWHRRHDYWLLCGMAVHGYGHYDDILKDPRFAIINEPFKAGLIAFRESKTNFLQRRYKLLEQALIVEEQLRRAARLAEQPPLSKSDAAKAKNTLNGNGGNASSSQAYAISSSSLESGTQPQPEAEQKKADADDEIECLTPDEPKCNGTNITLNSAKLLKVIAQMEDLLTDMKSDVSRMPVTLSRLRPLAEALGIRERDILNRLTSKDPNAEAGQGIEPMEGTFAVQGGGPRLKFAEVQPKFAIVVREKPLEKAKTPNVADEVITTPTDGIKDEAEKSDVKVEENLSISKNAKDSSTTEVNLSADDDESEQQAVKAEEETVKQTSSDTAQEEKIQSSEESPKIDEEEAKANEEPSGEGKVENVEMVDDLDGAQSDEKS